MLLITFLALAILSLEYPTPQGLVAGGFWTIVVLVVATNTFASVERLREVAWLPTLDRIADGLAWLLPTDWVIHPLRRAMVDGGLASAWVWAPWLGLVGWAGYRGCRLWRQLRPRDRVFYQLAHQLPEDCPPEVVEAFHHQLDRATAPASEVETFVHSRRFLEPTRPPPTDPLWRWLWRRWNPRQRLLAEWGAAAWPRWVRFWCGAALIVGIGFALAWAGRMTDAEQAGWLGMILVIAGVVISLPWTATLSRATGGKNRRGMACPLVLLYPVTLREVLRLERDCATVRVLLVLPLLAVAGAGLASLADEPVSVGVLMALNGLILFFGVRSLGRAVWCWRGAPRRGLIWVLIPVTIAAVVMAMSFAIISFIISSEGPGVGGALFSLLAWGIGELYARGVIWLWSWRWFDAPSQRRGVCAKRPPTRKAGALARCAGA